MHVRTILAMEWCVALPSYVLVGRLPLALRANAVLRRCSASLPAMHVKTAAFNHSATSPT